MASESFIQKYVNAHPKGFWFLFWGELAERLSYYGMMAILTLYLKESLKINEADSSRWSSFFQAATYITPLIGGFLADRFFGRYWTIVGFAIPYILGNWLMTFEILPEQVYRFYDDNGKEVFVIPPLIMLFSMVILAIGSGVIKPNLSILLGLTYDQQRPGRLQLRSTAFSMFYWAINVGALIANAAMPWLRNNYGPNVAFWLPTILMIVALTLFASGKKYYAVESIKREVKTPEEKALQWQTLWKLLGVFLLCIVFWHVMKQYNTTWVHFTSGRLDTTIGKTTFKADQFSVLNSIFVLTLLPLSSFLFAWLESKGHKIRPTDKMQVGFVFTALTPLMFILADQFAGEGKASILWLVLGYFFITTAEILISPVGLELAFVAAPKTMKGFITACFLLTIFTGVTLNGFITPYYSKLNDAGQKVLSPTQYFGGQLLVCVLAVVAFYFIAKPFNRTMAAQASAQGKTE